MYKMKRIWDDIDLFDWNSNTTKHVSMLNLIVHDKDRWAQIESDLEIDIDEQIDFECTIRNT